MQSSRGIETLNDDDDDDDPVPFNSTEFEGNNDTIRQKIESENRSRQIIAAGAVTTSDNVEDSNSSTSVVVDNTHHLVSNQSDIPILEATLVPDMPVYEASLVVEEEEVANNAVNTEETSEKRTTKINTQELSDMVVKAAKNGRRTNKVSSSLAQLNITDMKLHGRENDMKLLRSKLLELKNGRRESVDDNMKSLPELVLISGISGSGKSSLVMKGVKEPAEKMGMTFISGKFDLNNTASMPLSAFADAMESLTKLVMESDMRMKKKIQEDINESFDDRDTMLLVKALPGCGKLFPLHKDEASQHDDKKTVAIRAQQHYETLSVVGKEAIARLQYAIRRLLKVVCTHLKGVVLFIDDLQWSDTATLDLLQSISLDDVIPSILMIGAYREDEVPDTHPLALHLHEKEQMGIEITTIKIGNLTLDSVTSLVAEALRTEESEVESLATTVHRKTEGNVFYVLYDEKLLVYNFGIMKWTWDDITVQQKLATENVATVLINKLRRHSSRTQNVVKVASILGSTFNLSVVSAVLDNLPPSELKRLSSTLETDNDSDDGAPSTSILNISAQELESEGLWEQKCGDLWQFGHDKIQAAAYDLIPDEKKDLFRGKIGLILLDKLEETALESNLFEIVSLCNCAMSSISGEGKRRVLANLNLRAGMKALDNTAFDSATTYFKAGRELLGPNGWCTDYSSMLQLHSRGANAYFLSGQLDTMKQLINEVFSQDIPVVDKFEVYVVKIKAAYALFENHEAVNTAFEFRRQLGLPTFHNKPVNKLIIIKEFIKTKRALGSMKAEDIASLPELTDDRIMMGQRMLELAFTAAFGIQPTVFPLIVFALVRASLKHGTNASSCDSFGGYGIILNTLGKLQEGKEMARTVELLLAKPNMERMRSRSIFICEGMINHWTAPLQGTLAPLLQGYQTGIQSGDLESAAINLIFRVMALYYSGRPLDSLQAETKTSIDAMKHMNQNMLGGTLTPWLILFKKLAGTFIEENDMNFEGTMKIALELDSHVRRAYTIMCLVELNVYFQEWQNAARLLEDNNIHEVLRGFFASARFTFLEALISVQAAQCDATKWHKKRAWKRRAYKSRKMISSWVKKGNVNLVHYLHLLDAELAALNGNYKKAQVSFTAAITVARRNGFIQDRALAHELASAYFESREDAYWKDYHMERCLECYNEWGAIAKVQQLTEKNMER